MLIALLTTMARIDKTNVLNESNKTSTGWKPQGKQINKELHERIRKHLIEGRLTKQETATIVDCGIATVYRFEGFVYNHFIVYAAGEQSPSNVYAKATTPPQEHSHTLTLGGSWLIVFWYVQNVAIFGKSVN